MNDNEKVNWDENGLVPAIVQDSATGDVRMLGYVSRESLQLTIDTGFMHFYSRSRQTIWKKGETSGNLQSVIEMRTDCDQDAVWIKVRVAGDGATCHTGRRSCFYRTVERDGQLGRLVQDEPGTPPYIS